MDQLGQGGPVDALAGVTDYSSQATNDHRWYRETFEGYPANRKAVIPGIFRTFSEVAPSLSLRHLEAVTDPMFEILHRSRPPVCHRPCCDR